MQEVDVLLNIKKPCIQGIIKWTMDLRELPAVIL